MSVSSKGQSLNHTKQFLNKLADFGSIALKNICEKPEKRMIAHLIKKEVIETSEIDGITTIHLTKKGETKLLKYKLEDIRIKRPKKWDGKWRIVVFDIPEKHKVARNVLKRKLDELGFAQIQKSVYAHPFECTEEIEFIRILYQIRPFISIIIAEELENSEKIKQKFGI